VVKGKSVSVSVLANAMGSAARTPRDAAHIGRKRRKVKKISEFGKSASDLKAMAAILPRL
jgi:hypothetical protein